MKTKLMYLSIRMPLSKESMRSHTLATKFKSHIARGTDWNIFHWFFIRPVPSLRELTLEDIPKYSFYDLPYKWEILKYVRDSAWK